MGMLIDSGKSFISILILYIEEPKKHGGSLFHFIRSPTDLEDWKKKGFNTVEEIQQVKPETQDNTPGMPIKQTKIDPTKKIETLKTWWQRLTWKDQNNIFAKCLTQKPLEDGRIQTSLDTIKYRDMKLKTCLKRWDLRNEQGAEIPVTEVVIDSLVPEVAAELLNNFERVMESPDSE